MFAFYSPISPPPYIGPRNAVLVHGTRDRNLLVRATALLAIAERGDSTLAGEIEPVLEDSLSEAKYTAGAAILRLCAPSDVGKTAEKTKQCCSTYHFGITFHLIHIH